MSDSLLDGIAIIGVHGRFPGANSTEAFWQNLIAGKETISFFTDDELKSSGLDPMALRRAGHYVPARGVLKDAEYFDAAFFGIHPKEAEVMDPQQRVFLETCWEALERAGYAPDRTTGTVGVFGGSTFNTYYLHALHPRAELRELVGREQVMLGNEKDYLTTRVAYKLNLRGPAISLDTACSSSMVAVSQACQSLLTYQCSMALAGGVSVRVPQIGGYFHQEGNIASADGHTRTFDASSKGTVFSNGVTMVVLKRLSEAIEDGDEIYAVIKGTAVNNDGSQRVSFGAPGVEGQSEAISLAQELAGFEPDSLSYIEAHGTATPIGDPIEVAALTKAFRRHTQRKQFCALGSVKTNIGHLDAAAGTAGLIKVALSLKHGLIPPTLHFQSPNPRLDLENSPFFVNTVLREWKTESGLPRRAGVSSFGTGGTNAHAVLEQAPEIEPTGPARSHQLLILSAKTADALEAMTRNLADHLEKNAEIHLADVAYTLQVGRSEFAHRRVLVVKDRLDAIALLRSPEPRRVFTARPELKDPAVVFMFPGQGAQYVNMGAELYEKETVFRESVDRCAEILQPVLGADLRSILFVEPANEKEADEQLRQTRLTQPALFTIEYALSQLWRSWGIQPVALIGHSVGEYVAACLSGVFTLEDALTLVARRAALVQSQPHGSMLAVRLSEAELTPHLDASLSIAAINSPSLCVVSGATDAIDAFEKRLAEKGIAAKKLHTSHAFHSTMMEPVVAPFTQLVENCPRSEPQLPFVSNVTGRWVTNAETNSPTYWANHVRQAVRFADGVAVLLGNPQQVLIEVGPGQTLFQLARQHPERKEQQPVLSTLGGARDQETASLLTAVGRLWLAGSVIDWKAFHAGTRRRRLVLPTYPFDRKRYWPEGLPSITPKQPSAELAATAPAVYAPTACLPITELPAGAQSPLPAPDPMNEATPAPDEEIPVPTVPRKERLIAETRALLQDLSGTNLEGSDPTSNFIELGLDSLLLTQAAQLLSQKFGVAVSFRQLMEELSSLDAVVTYVDRSMPADPPPAPRPVRRPAVTAVALPAATTPIVMSAAPAGSIEQLLVQQIALTNQLLGLVVGRGALPAAPAALPAAAPAPALRPAQPAPISAPTVTATDQKAAFGPYRPPETSANANSLSAEQRAFIDQLISEYTARTRKSKEHTQRYRKVLADPRTVAGFRPFWKEMVYPIVVERSKNSRMWDVDGNEYIDFSMGFGTNLLGHSPDFVNDLIAEQLSKGIEVGPQTPLAGKVAELMCELTGMERCAFANTGSEAVLATIRIARTVTGRKRIVYFTGDYHGIFDEVLQRSVGSGPTSRLLPIAPGIPHQSMEHITILDYDRPESLETIRALGSEIAAVIVEPIQSRRPDLQPREFLLALRKLTEEIGSALVFDEVITGFRTHPGGVQGLYGIQADMASYGKLIGGGIPIGAICGKAKFMDALDGGFWAYGDNSIPEVGVTFFAGTYVRHPLSMAGAYAVLSHLKEQGPALQQGLADKMTAIVKELNAFLLERNAPVFLEHFRSYFWTRFETGQKYGSLLFFLLRNKGIHIFEGRLFFLATSHTDNECAKLVEAFKASIMEMQDAGFLSGGTRPTAGEKPVETKALNAKPALNPERSGAPLPILPSASMDFSVYFFGNYPAEFDPQKYELVLKGTKFADAAGFKAVWLPERHFHAVGGYSPNPSVVAAALARETKQIQLRGGSVVLPLHHPVRVAEEWSMVDNLSNGRVGLSIASGWHPNDFVFAPDAFDRRRELCTEGLATIRKLWSGESLSTRTGKGNTIAVKLHPMPAQRELPVWLTCVQAASYEKAGELGVGVLAMLTNQTLDEVAEKIAIYRDSRARHGFDPATGNVTMLVHTFVDADYDAAVAKARKPMHDYLRAYIDNSQKRHESNSAPMKLSDEDMNYLLDRSFNDYLQGKALIGTPESCALTVEKLRTIGVNEIGCFIDFGVEPEAVLKNLTHLGALKNRVDATPVQPAAPLTIPLSDTQRGLWLLSRMTPKGNQAYTEFVSVQLDGPLQVPALKDSLQVLINRHQSFRSTVVGDGDTQQIASTAELPFSLIDLSSLSGTEQANRLKEEVVRIDSTLFDFTKAPGLSAWVIRLASNRHLLVLQFHHILGNGPSYGVIFKELWAVYEALSNGRRPQLAPAMQLADFVTWLDQQTQRPQFAQDREFWLKQFSGPIPVLELPTDHARPPMMSFRGGRETLRINGEVTAALRKASGKLKASLFLTLCSAFKVLLHRLSGQSEVVVGVPFEGEVRQLPTGDHLVANTTNLIPLRTSINQDDTFALLVKRVKSLVLEANEHQSYFFGNLIKDLKLKHDPARSPIVAVSFNLERSIGSQQVGALTTTFVIDDVPYANARGSSKFELAVNIVDSGNELRVDCDYHSDLFDAATIQRWLSHYQTLLQGITLQPDTLVSELPLLNAAERQWLVHGFNAASTTPSATTLTQGDDQTLVTLFEAAVAKTPDAIALTCDQIKLSYRQLNAQANRIARRLVNEGVKPDTMVGLCLDRVPELVVAILGILKAGGAYLPIDLTYPADRLAFMLEDAKAPVILTQTKLLPNLPVTPAKAYCVDQILSEPARADAEANLPQSARADHLAYVIYTSGTTGKPKGSLITHRNVTRLFTATDHWFHFNSKDVWTLFHSAAFDFSVWEIWGALLYGGRLVVVPYMVSRSPEAFYELLAKEQVTVLNQTPSAFRQLMQAEETVGQKPLSLRYIVFGGEALEMQSLRPWFTRHGDQAPKLVNMYGITETTVHVTYRPLSQSDVAGGSVIGVPIPDLQVYVLDEKLQLAPIGIPGEMYVGGAGLARGYLNRSDLTAARFIPDHLTGQPSARLYKTGDLARVLPGRDIEYLGRIDHQVKIRGFRIELGEIESVLSQHPEMRETLVLAREDVPGDKRLVAYLVTKDGSKPEVVTLREHLKKKVPEYMVPSAFVFLPAFPLTNNGKVDRKALPAPDLQSAESSRNYIAPVGENEQLIAEIWSEVLQIPKIGRHDNFFELGGHSLIALKVVSRIRQVFGFDAPLSVIFEAGNVADLATKVADLQLASVDEDELDRMLAEIESSSGKDSPSQAPRS